LFHLFYHPFVLGKWKEREREKTIDFFSCLLFWNVDKAPFSMHAHIHLCKAIFFISRRKGKNCRRGPSKQREEKECVCERYIETERWQRTIIRHKRVTLSSHMRCNEQWLLVGEKSEWERKCLWEDYTKWEKERRERRIYYLMTSKNNEVLVSLSLFLIFNCSHKPSHWTVKLQL